MSTVSLDQELPTYTNPPLVEVVLAVQFVPIPGLTNGHLGKFWNSLGSEWPKAADFPPLGRVNVAFGEDVWQPSGLRIGVAGSESRLQIFSAKNEDRIIQVQNGWFVFNWRRKDGGAEYPRFNVVKSEFDEHIRRFTIFLADQNLENLTPTVWEVTYVNHVRRDKLWQSTADWSKALPGLFAGVPILERGQLEDRKATLEYVLGNREGRLTLTSNLARVVGEGPEECLVVQLTARGPISQDNPNDSLENGLALGRRSVVKLFDSLPSSEAQQHWGRVGK